ncbi:hypothetical protein JD844_027824 [Phrynosoma platyrhinos]|uniref:Uncharacterized protein n=1 Tax=Phrynosoma platyrhinos TaxID=52577 RepID=A0ABQ7SGY6_PHRPL|nr:hypothetical protein JD844_027824 [Phrynosoma platyrhinos]
MPSRASSLKHRPTSTTPSPAKGAGSGCRLSASWTAFCYSHPQQHVHVYAIDYYRKLLYCLNRKKFPSEYVPGPGYAQLIFESYYHTGVAFQKLNSHREALEEFTYAMEETNIPKTACKVGCATSSFYHTPVFARRAYAYVKCDKIKEAINDATRAVNSDPTNPAFKLCPESAHFFDVEDFHSPKMPSFYDKFLRSLNAFHTITEINLFAGATFVSTLDINRGPRIPTAMKPFRHGYEEDSDNFSLLRRKAYIQACLETGIIFSGSRPGSAKKGSGSSGVQESVKEDSSSSLVQEYGNYCVNFLEERPKIISGPGIW